MVGDPAQSIIADYYAFGATHFKRQQALADMLKQATTVNDVRPGEALEQKYGYLPENGSYGCCNPHGYVPTLLEYDSEDLALSHFAAALGDRTDATMLEQRANNWENVFDPAGDLLTPRNENGQFVDGITPTTTGPYVEGDAYEYLWNTPNNYSTLFSLLGGNVQGRPRAAQYLSEPEGFGMFAQLDERVRLRRAVRARLRRRPRRHPAGRQQHPRRRCTRRARAAWTTTTTWAPTARRSSGRCSGMYPENSGIDTLVFASPGFPQAAIKLANGHTITINAPGASPSRYYVKSLKLNGNELQQAVRPVLEARQRRDARLDARHHRRPTGAARRRTRRRPTPRAPGRSSASCPSRR